MSIQRLINILYKSAKQTDLIKQHIRKKTEINNLIDHAF